MDGRLLQMKQNITEAGIVLVAITYKLSPSSRYFWRRKSRFIFGSFYLKAI